MKGNIDLVTKDLLKLPNKKKILLDKSKKFRKIYFLLKDVLESQRMNVLFQSFSDLVQVPIAVIDLNGNVLASSNWQTICTDFHRVDSQTCAKCIESDTILSSSLIKNKQYSLYECKNGLIDCASPIIVEKEHVANLFIGQFLLKEPDILFFKNQAKKYKFDEKRYLDALANVSIVSESKSKKILNFMVKFADILTVLSYEKYLSGKNDKLYSKKLSKKNKKLKYLNNNLEEIVKERTVKLEYYANHDSLTGIYNRRSFFKLGKKEFILHDNVFIIMIDIDYFKKINDTYGHDIGDKVLVKLTSFISENYLNNNSIFGRLGGEEFSIIYFDSDIVTIEKKIKQLCSDVSTLAIFLDEKVINFTISIGVAEKKDDSKSLDQLLKIADDNLYQAKETGRNKAIFRENSEK